MTPVFLDTGYLIALEASDDENHRAALRHWQTFRRKLPPLVTTSLVLSETVTFFNSRGQHAKAVEVGNRLLESPSVTLVQVDDALLQRDWEYFQKHGDKSFSLTDGVSFVLMKERGINRALAFDKHFAQAGFTKLP
ncbi:MAG: PIN domain-containing protein [Verrucomicrobiae bacterium]|nr:PIN domain-containing protein [Verrucomicrobiae bacterium]